MQHPVYAILLSGIDGDIQLPLLLWMKERLSAEGVDYIDHIALPEIEKKIIAGNQVIADAINYSLNNHYAQTIAIAGHAILDIDDDARESAEQIKQRVISAAKLLVNDEWQRPVLGLFVDQYSQVELIFDSEGN